MRWGVIGDLHLGKLSSLIPNHLDLQIECLENIIREIRKNNIKTIILLGDVFDKPIAPTHIIIRLLQFFIKHNDLKFHWVQGNHDKYSKNMASIDLFSEITLPHVRIYTEPTKLEYVGFLPYPYKNPLEKTVLSFAHTESPGAVYPNGSVVCDKEWNENHIYIIGHIHKSQKIRSTYYTGTPYKLSFAETGNHHWAEIIFSKDRFKYIKHKIIPTYELQNIKINNKKQIQEFMELYKKHNFVWYRIIVKDASILPLNFLLNHERCKLHIIGKSKIIDKIVETPVNRSIKTGLDIFLKNREHSKKEIKWAMKLIGNLEEEYRNG